MLHRCTNRRIGSDSASTAGATRVSSAPGKRAPVPRRRHRAEPPITGRQPQRGRPPPDEPVEIGAASPVERRAGGGQKRADIVVAESQFGGADPQHHAAPFDIAGRHLRQRTARQHQPQLRAADAEAADRAWRAPEGRSAGRYRRGPAAADGHRRRSARPAPPRPLRRSTDERHPRPPRHGPPGRPRLSGPWWRARRPRHRTTASRSTSPRPVPARTAPRTRPSSHNRLSACTTASS